MNRILILLLTAACSLGAWGQTLPSDSILRQQLDSVLAEADRIYRYERATWLATDLARNNKVVSQDFGSYLTYEHGTTVKTIIIDKAQKQCVAEYAFADGGDKPSSQSAIKRELNAFENQLLKIRSYVVNQLSSSRYDVRSAQGASLNLILLADSTQYKLYIISGTSSSGIIPLGNDYLLTADEKGKITSYTKFHSSLMPVYTTIPHGGKIREVTHSHKQDTPLITATDICTFRLYGHYYDLDKMSVYSPALKRTMLYTRSTNSIELLDK